MQTQMPLRGAALLIVLALLSTGVSVDANVEVDAASTPEMSAKMGFLIEPNHGQFEESVLFSATLDENRVMVTNDRMMVVQTGGETVMDPADPEFDPEAESTAWTEVHVLHFPGTATGVEFGDKLSTKVHYIKGEKEDWVTGVQAVTSARVTEVLPGVDLYFYGTEDGRLEFDWQLDAGISPGVVSLTTDSTVTIEDGALVLHGDMGMVTLQPPQTFQEGTIIESQYGLTDGVVSFQVPQYDASKPLVIDPVFVFATYLGGSSIDYVHDMDLAPDGTIVFAGETYSSNIPVKDAYQSSARSNYDAFAGRYNPTTYELISLTYFGGNDEDKALGVAAAPDNTIVIAGHTESATNELFPTKNAYQGNIRHTSYDDMFLTKFNADGDDLVFSTYYGDYYLEHARAVDVNANGDIFMAGDSYAYAFYTITTTDAYKTKPPQYYTYQPLVSQWGSDGTLKYGSYFGGNYYTYIRGVAAKDDGTFYAVGETRSWTKIETKNAYQEERTVASSSSSYRDGLIIGFDPSKSGDESLIYSSYLGGQYATTLFGIAVEGNLLHVTGYSSGGNPEYPTTEGALQEEKKGSTSSGSYDGVYSIIDASKSGESALVYSTYIGSDGSSDVIYDVALDSSGTYLVGRAHDDTMTGGNPSQYVGSYDGYVLKLDKDRDVDWSQFVGTISTDQFYAAVALGDRVAVAGYSAWSGLPSINSWQPGRAGSNDGYIGILEYIPPYTEAIFTPDDPCADGTMVFSADYGYSEAPFLSNDWDWDGDGTIDDSGDVIEREFEPGWYNGKLTTSWADGMTKESPFTFFFDSNLVGPESVSVNEPVLVNEGALVPLFAYAEDPDGDELDYYWNTIAGPVVSVVGPGESPTFVAPEVARNGEEHFIELEVTATDGCYPVTATTSVRVQNINQAPVANAGMDDVIEEGRMVGADGSASYDPDMDDITVLWTVIEGNIHLDDPTSLTPSFTAPKIQGYKSDPMTLQLQIEDPYGLVSIDTVSYRVIGSGDTGSGTSGGGGGGSVYGGSGGYQYNPKDGGAECAQEGQCSPEGAPSETEPVPEDPTPEESSDEVTVIDLSTKEVPPEEDPRYEGYDVYQYVGNASSTGDAIGIHDVHAEAQAPGLPLMALLAAIVGLVWARRRVP